MSVQSVQAFWQKAKQDAVLQAQLKALQSQHQQAIAAAVVQIAATAGLAFTTEEYETAVKEALGRQHAAGELSEEQLGLIAGGYYSFEICCLAKKQT
jgi:predicted ribosomally synthesized peptide with nif11-like leader